MNTTESSRFRFVVRSAGEAVTVLREKLGPRARVVSVRQVQGKGLARFLSAPSLEVIAEVAAESPAPTPGKPEPVAEVAPAEPAPPPEVQPAPSLFTPPESGLASLLRAAGLSAPLIAQMQGETDWKLWERMSPAQALTQAGIGLRKTWMRRSPRALGDRIAFVGSPGAGKTTALCKQLAVDTFVRGRRPAVLKLDLENANPCDGLAVFCEALGVTFSRDPSELPALATGSALYIDVPGVIPSDPNQTALLREALDSVATTSRVLVLNAAYDPEILKDTWMWGTGFDCSHTVFTHLDELKRWSKLWDFILPPAPTPLFLSTGQSIAGDMDENVFDAVLARTFPEPVNPLQAAA